MEQQAVLVRRLKRTSENEAFSQESIVLYNNSVAIMCDFYYIEKMSRSTKGVVYMPEISRTSSSKVFIITQLEDVSKSVGNMIR